MEIVIGANLEDFHVFKTTIPDPILEEFKFGARIFIGYTIGLCRIQYGKEIESIIQGIDQTKSPGPDDLPPI